MVDKILAALLHQDQLSNKLSRLLGKLLLPNYRYGFLAPKYSDELTLPE